MPQLRTLANWLRVEVVVPADGLGPSLLRFRVHTTGKWAEREATPEEVLLYDALRGLVAVHEEAPWGVVARALNLSSEQASVNDVLTAIADLHETTRSHAEGIRKLAAALQSAERELGEMRDAPRLTPKGGDRNELARQVRRLAVRALEALGEPFSEEEQVQRAVWQGELSMANTVLRMIGAEAVAS